MAMHLSVTTCRADHELAQIQAVIEKKMLVEERGGFEQLLCDLLASGDDPTPKTLDLIGHSTPDHVLLLGNWTIDAASSTVRAFFRELADQEVFSRLGVHTLRLLGCETAVTEHGIATLRTLADILGIDVCGTKQMIHAGHYDSDGFRDDFTNLLFHSSEVHGAILMPRTGELPYQRVLDIEMLPTSPLESHRTPWPLRVATLDAARQLLQLVRRSEGAQMPGLMAAPTCEVALPAGASGWYHRIQIFLNGEFVRVYPEGDRGPGIVFPIVDACSLRELVDGLRRCDLS